MKKTVPLLTLAICAIAAVSYSSLIYTETILNDGDNGAGNTVAANSTNSTSTMIPVLVSSSTCTIQVRHRLVASSTALVTYTIQKNDQKDSTNWVTHGSFGVTSAGTAEVWGRTNITIGDYGYIRVIFTNETPRVLTNLDIRIYRKE